MFGLTYHTIKCSPIKGQRKENQMGLNGATHLQELNTIIPGHGIKKILAGVDLSSWRTSAGLILEGATAPLRASLETVFEGVQSASGTTDGGSLQIVIPRDYDQSVDKLKIRFLAQSASTDVPTIDAAMYRKREGVAITADLDPTISEAINTATALAGWVEINCDDQELQPGDAVHFDFTLSAHASHAANFYALEVEYAGTIVYYDKTDRS